MTNASNSPTIQTFKDLALPLVERGIPVIPVVPFGKNPELSVAAKRSTLSAEQVLAWDAQWPDHNVGCVGTPETVVILDCDVPGLMTRIEQETGHKLPQTFTVKSAGKGCAHLYFRQTEVSRALGNKAVGGLFDLRSDNTYVVGPNSKLRMPDGKINTYKIWRDSEIADFPGLWLADWLRTAKSTTKRAAGGIGEADVDALEVLKAAYRKRGEFGDMLGIKDLHLNGDHPTMVSLSGYLYNNWEMDRENELEDHIDILEKVWDEYGASPDGPRKPNEARDIANHVFRKSRKFLFDSSGAWLDPDCAKQDVWTVDDNRHGLRFFTSRSERDAFLSEVPQYPEEALEGDAISDFTHAVTDGTGIPPQYVRSLLSSAVELAMDHRIGYPNHETIRMHPYSIHVSDEARTGKGEAFKRTFDEKNGRAKELLGGAKLLEGTNCGSGQYAVKKIQDLQNKSDRELRAKEAATTPTDQPLTEDNIPFSGEHEIRSEADIHRLLKNYNLPSEAEEAKHLRKTPDEQAAALDRDLKRVRSARDKDIEKQRKTERIRKPQPQDDYLRVWMIHDELSNAYKSADRSTEECLLAAYERDFVCHGSFANEERRVDNVSLAFHGDATRRAFEEIFTGQASANSGFLARCKLTYGTKRLVANWSSPNLGAAATAIQKLVAAVSALPKSTIENEAPFIPQESQEATQLREDFFAELGYEEALFATELDSHFRRDVLVRMVASGGKTITADNVKRAVLWARYQLALRKALYPADQEDAIGQISAKILKLLDTEPVGAWTDRDFTRQLHLNSRNHGTSEQYLRARNSLIKSHEIKAYGMNRSRRALYQRTAPVAPFKVSDEDRDRLKEHKKNGAKQEVA
jgi:hypothetical protein